MGQRGWAALRDVLESIDAGSLLPALAAVSGT